MKKPPSISRRFLRSVNLVRDRQSDHGLEGYVVTASVRQALARLGHGLGGTRHDRAFTLTGPYGTGKSSFALFLFHLLRHPNGQAWTALRKADPRLADDFRSVVWPKRFPGGYACLVATASTRQSVPELLADAVDSHVGKVPRTVVALSSQLREARDPRDIVRLVESIAQEFRQAGYAGVLFLVDEFGRVFENARLHPSETDVSVLQDLAEVASRGKETGLALMGILHQGVGDYAASDPALRREFSKIAGRFDSIVFRETPASQILLIASAIRSSGPLPATDERILKETIRCGVPNLVGLSDGEFAKHARASYPLHPLALAALPILFRRLGQNERSVFSYLAGNEPKSLLALTADANPPERVCLHDLYDYLFTNFEAQLSRNPFGQALLEANEALSSKDDLQDEDRLTLKTIALLSSLGTQCPLRATKPLVSLALHPARVDDSLEKLKRLSIVVYRKFNGTYALWNGSDVDLEDCEKRADAELGKTGFSLAETLGKFLPPEPVVAKRHSCETGSLRFFKTVYADRPSDLDPVSRQDRGTSSGLLVVCLPERRSEIDTFLAEARRLSAGDPSLLFAVPRECGDLREALKEVRRLHWIEDTEKALRDDKIASREVSIRLAEATQGVQLRQFGLLDPKPSPHGVECVFVCDGARQEGIRSGRDLTRLFSERCDRLYPETPRVRNELINRRAPSSQAASARNKLVALINNPETCKLPLLGIEGYPPERSIYESVFLASGMHVQGDDGGWRLAAPREDAPTNLLPAWKKLESIVMDAPGKPVTIREIYDELRRPPYGMLDGLLPLLVIAFYLVNRDEVFLYQEGSFLPEPTDAQFELLVRRPELFALSGMKITGTRAAIVQRLATGLKTGSETVMPVVRRLYALRNSLSKYARETDAVSDTAKAFRKAFEDAKSPEVLLFRTLPAVFGLPDLDAARLDKKQLDSYFTGLNACLQELGNALPALVSESRNQLLSAFGFENTPDGWRVLYDRCCYLLARIGSSDLVPFLQNVKNTDGDWNKASQVIAYLVQSPMEKWGPLQKAEFAKTVVGVSERFAAAWRPYGGTVALSPKEEKAAEDLLARIRTTAQKAEASVLRAALLRALAELDGKG